jgi:DNA-binding NarL/FixJ family response regulator
VSEAHRPSSAPLEVAPRRARRCLVVDDHEVVLDAVGRLLEAAGLEVVCRAKREEEALAASERYRPDVAICDVRLRSGSGIELVRSIRRLSAQTAAVVYTAYSDRALVREALDAGAAAYVLKEAPLADLLRAIDTVLEGGTYVDGSLASLLAQGEEEGEALTARERDVLRLAAAGLRTDEIARRMFLSAATVKAHLVKAQRKLGARTRAQAVAVALRRGLIA